MAIRVTVADDQAVVRAGIAAILDAEPDLCVVGQAADGDTAVELALSARPDVALMDVRMPGIGGLAATAAITERSPATRVLVLTTFGLDEYLFAALRAGAAGFLLKDAEPERVIDAVRVVHGGAALLDPAVTRTLIDRFTDGPGPLDTTRLDLLTPRETEVLRQVARGLSNAEIAAVLGVSPPTVKDHVSVLLGKLGVRDRVQATIAAYETGLIRPGSGP
ncbi:MULTISPECIES: response regulator [Streptomyces]|uniref:DNA-binding NarL/FixJ family response regulator n=1 Tax=Streptomyces demainii TaxID=588122 RepID=A0ABT9KNZ3_9ACTN|nr:MULTISPECIES: response regulator transcription factor [Streptomyces]MBW8092570.1 response regulator transcription factor [Streptomyces hygroscopicus subsp. hygroscopicus]MCO8306212.1 response regulator transcription factor [Streptomyces sp. RKCA744]MDP9610158.1 DNA-binding NarL/FixJ family response regulator [Streptomyces demainii]